MENSSVTTSKQKETITRALCVDLDGTLLATDMLWECFVLALRQAPIALLCFPFWLLKGRAFAKARLAERVQPDFANLPYRQDFVAVLKDELAAGNQLVLVTASDAKIAEG